MFRLPLPLPFILGLLTDLCENCSVAAYRGECMHDSLFFFHKSRVGMSRSYYMKMRAVASVDCLSALGPNWALSVRLPPVCLYVHVGYPAETGEPIVDVFGHELVWA